MQLTHVAVWTNDPERLRDFYTCWFAGKSNDKYINPAKGFCSYFVTFEGGTSLEIMSRKDITEGFEAPHTGLTHIAFQVKSVKEVDEAIERFRKAGVPIAGEPRHTGDGFYEGSVLDPDGNLIEITAYPDVEIVKTDNPPYDLLLLADPDREKVDAYLPFSDAYIARYKFVTEGVIVVQKLNSETAEIMNLAVGEQFQRRGIARRLLCEIINVWSKANHIKRLIIRTGTSAPGPLMLYQQEGFDLKEVKYDYFVQNYDFPIMENGIQCKHQLILERLIK